MLNMTTKDMADLEKLKEKFKNYQPLTDDELERIGERAAAHYDGMEVKMGVMMKSWNSFASMLSSLSGDNLRLAADVTYWKNEAKKK